MNTALEQRLSNNEMRRMIEHSEGYRKGGIQKLGSNPIRSQLEGTLRACQRYDARVARERAMHIDVVA